MANVGNRRTFVFDLDGTVLNSKNEFPEEVKELVLNILSNGDLVVFATGRMHVSAKKLLDRVFEGRVDFPIISYNGAVVYVPGEGIVFKRTLTKETADKIVDFFKSKGVHIQSYVDDGLYSEKDSEEVKLYSTHADIPYVVVDDLKKLPAPVKMLAIASAEVLDNLIPEVKGLVGESANVFKSFPIFLDMVPPDANKGIALSFLAKKLNFDLRCTTVFGDNENDIFMFEVAGTRVAVQNAVEKLKEVADFVTLSNDENGVLYAFSVLYPQYLPEYLRRNVEK
ncbi:Cof-type HAD-IIB family hydrolase [Fervidobacterium thailandense]|uniref:Hydrolase Cof n=1 Tax=Fervidobacterium thailandense TaxID=1008305 RepID=A0A1E3G5E5_9BACT|nr:Cof-type HAD-IIB family hydrolase [Fervidobacterium thailandense]ODN30868.1 hydrolase Cof [Fervidobacterium thailandense]